jgi:hypothetical protein
MSQQAPSFVNFYSKQIERSGKLEALRLQIVIGVGAVLLLLLVVLASPWFVWLYVVLLFSVTYYGAHRLSFAIGVTKAAEEHLLEFAKFLRDPRSRDEFVQLVQSKISPEDDSNVPEALWSYCTGRQSGESGRVVAHSAFVRATAELNLAHFLRTTLVLGGLFGTVLFFATELGGRELLGGDLSALLPGLRGALASTLTGILGSIALGITGNNIDRVVEEAVWETESFISGPVSQVLAGQNASAPIQDEADLWTALRQEVALLRKDTVESYKKLADDAAAYAKALETVSQNLADLPAVQVPVQLANLQDVVARFGSSTDSLDRTVKTLVDSVATVGLIVPAQILNDLAHLRSAAGENHDTTMAEFDATTVRLATLRDSLQTVESRVSVVERAMSTSQQITDATAELGKKVDVRGAQTASGILSLGDQLRALGDIPTRDGHSGGIDSPPAADGSDMIEPLMHALSGVQESLALSIEEFKKTEQAVTALSSTIPTKLDQTLAGIADTQQKLSAVSRRLSPLDRVYGWHERAAHAPLMKLLLLSLGRPKAASDGS